MEAMISFGMALDELSLTRYTSLSMVQWIHASANGAASACRDAMLPGFTQSAARDTTECPPRAAVLFTTSRALCWIIVYDLLILAFSFAHIAMTTTSAHSLRYAFFNRLMISCECQTQGSCKPQASGAASCQMLGPTAL